MNVYPDTMREQVTMSDTGARSEEHASIDGVHALMERYVDGDERAFTQLHARLVPRIRSRLSRLVRDPALLDDLVQLTFMRAHVARARFEVPDEQPDRAVEAWYGAISRNVALDALRHRYRREQRHSKLEVRGDVAAYGGREDLVNPEELQLEREDVAAEIDRVRNAIEQLPPSQREVVVLHKLAGLSMNEVASRLGVQPGAIRVRAHRAYKALAGMLLGKPAIAA